MKSVFGVPMPVTSFHSLVAAGLASGLQRDAREGGREGMAAGAC